MLSRMFVWLLMCFVVIFIGTVVAVFVWLVPAHPQYPYDVDIHRQIAGLDWTIRQLQPVYLLARHSNNQTVYWVAYRDERQRLQLKKLFITGILEATNLNQISWIYGEKQWKMISGNEVNTLFHFGQRIGVQYFSSEITPFDVNNSRIVQICQQSSRLCNLGKIIVERKNQDNLTLPYSLTNQLKK